MLFHRDNIYFYLFLLRTQEPTKQKVEELKEIVRGEIYMSDAHNFNKLIELVDAV